MEASTFVCTVPTKTHHSIKHSNCRLTRGRHPARVRLPLGDKGGVRLIFGHLLLRCRGLRHVLLHAAGSGAHREPERRQHGSTVSFSPAAKLAWWYACICVRHARATSGGRVLLDSSLCVLGGPLMWLELLQCGNVLFRYRINIPV